MKQGEGRKGNLETDCGNSIQLAVSLSEPSPRAVRKLDKATAFSSFISAWG
jgi:hypothetical protein